MKTLRLIYIVTFLFVIASGASAQNSPIYIGGTKFAYPLIEKWIAEYSKVNPNIQIKLVQRKDEVKNPELTVIAHLPAAGEVKQSQDILYVSKYALVPVTNSQNPLLAGVGKKGLGKKQIERLFFEESIFDDNAKKEKLKFKTTVYAREGQACTSTTLANYFGFNSSEIIGKKVLGDDIYLLSAIKKDTFGISFNNLGNIFDNGSRQLKEGISVLPLDLKKEVKEALTSNEDGAIALLEKNQIESIPVEKVGFVYSQTNQRKELVGFLKWVLTEGQQYNHAYGFLNLDQSTLADQSDKLADKLLTLK